MLLTFLSRVMSSLLTLLLFTTVVGAAADQTILKTSYIEHTLTSQNAYERLSEALSKKIAEESGDPALSQEAVAAQLKDVLTPEVLHDKINTTLKQLQAYYRGDGPVPTLDISDPVAQAKANGLEIDEDKFDKPVELTGLTQTKKISDTAKIAGIGALVLLALLLAGVLAIAIKRKDFRPLANILFSLGLMLTITGTALLFVPQVFSRLYKFNPATNPFGSLAHDLAVIAVHDFGLRLLIPGLVALVGGIVWKALIRRARQAKPLDYAKADKPTILNDIPSPPPRPVSVKDAPTTPPTAAKTDTPGAPPAPRTPPKPRKIQL